jgi:hypothetical protein
MSTGQTLHVLADRSGEIVFAAIVDNDRKHPDEIRVVVSPMEGQSLVVVPVTDAIGKLEHTEDFRRLRTEFHVPPGARELAPKRRAAS